jgi:hypothetical protein
MKTLPLALCASALLAACASTGNHRTPSANTDAQFERLKSMEGEWVTMAAKDGAEAGMTIRYHVVGNGSTVIETMFPGSPHEMVTAYHKDGSDLMLTHYCAAGNQPQMRAEPGKGDDEIAFRFSGGTNIDKDNGTYMNAVDFKFVDSAHVIVTWKSRGHEGEAPMHFNLVRSWR